jgi:phosphopantothenoylcysteine decarboxylase/phosphopantothenate--cysteine ligase
MKSKKILLIITGSIAAYKVIDLIRLLKKNDFEVNCILTKAAQQFITPLLCSAISGTKTYHDLFNADDEIEMNHINLSRQCDLIVIAPASADFIAKLAHGYGDDLASTAVIAANKQIIIAPAMNEKMWHNKQNEQNITKIKELEFNVIEPETDILACGEYGIGKMANIETILKEILQYFDNKNLLKDKKILLTGGGTIEPIDPVRFIGNHSSGNQSIALAKILNELGANVTFIAANIKQAIPLNKNKIIHCQTADEMFEHTKKNLPGQDVFIACAAVADFKVKKISANKIKKTNNINPIIELEENIDILKYVSNHKQRPKLVIGFAAEDNNIEDYAKQKLKNKNCDFIIANDIKNGKIFGSKESHVKIISKNDIRDLGKISKKDLALIIAKIISS